MESVKVKVEPGIETKRKQGNETLRLNRNIVKNIKQELTEIEARPSYAAQTDQAKVQIVKREPNTEFSISKDEKPRITNVIVPYQVPVIKEEAHCVKIESQEYGLQACKKETLDKNQPEKNKTPSVKVRNPEMRLKKKVKYSCDLCSRRCFSLKEHKKAMHNIVEPDFVEKPKKENLREGLEILCRVCNKKFSSKSTRKNHFRRKHRASAQKTTKQSEKKNEICVCDECNQYFSTKESLKQHQKEIHNPFECEFCACRFPSLKSYHKHQDRHHDVYILHYSPGPAKKSRKTTPKTNESM